MKAVLALAFKTVRSAIRSRVAHVLLFFVLVTVLVLPATVASDGTAKGLVQVSLTYSLGIVGALLAVAAVWLGVTLMADEIETYQIHLVVTKPVSRGAVWFGKWLGVVLLLGGILLMAAAIILGMTYWRIQRAGFPEAERQQLRAEVLVGRRLFRPAERDLERRVDDELASRLRLGGGQLPPGMNDKMARDTIRSQLTQNEGEIRFANQNRWVFSHLPTDYPDDFVQLRFKLFVDRVKNRDQRETMGEWAIRNPRATDPREQLVVMPWRAMGGVGQELPVPRSFISDDGKLDVQYLNADPGGKSVVIQKVDGPFVMMGAVSFPNNFCRVVLLILIQIAFMATIGCAMGATTSTPVALFVSFAYVFIGLLLRYLRPEDPSEVTDPASFLMKLVARLRDGVEVVTVSLNDFIQVEPLTRGQLIDLGAILFTLLTVLVIRGGVFVAIGILGFRQRELGLVIRR
jgi:hypothetical protein